MNSASTEMNPLKFPVTTVDMENALVSRNSSPFSFTQHLVVNRTKDLVGHEADMLVLSDSGYVTEIEIKISKSDFRADFKKRHHHESGYVKYLYYAVPEFIGEWAVQNLPEGAGLVIVSPMPRVMKPYIYKIAEARKNVRKITDKMRVDFMRLMAMRYWSRQIAIRKKTVNDSADKYMKETRALYIKSHAKKAGC